MDETKQTGTERLRQSREHQGKKEIPVAEFSEIRGSALLADCRSFLKRTRQMWFLAAGTTLGLAIAFILVKDLTEWTRKALQRRKEQAVASVTPERLVARCGQPAEDVTKQVYPILMRTMSYQPGDNRKLVVAFSRTAEETSDWVFLSMSDESAAKNFDTPEAKVAAMPCLNSKK